MPLLRRLLGDHLYFHGWVGISGFAVHADTPFCFLVLMICSDICSLAFDVLMSSGKTLPSGIAESIPCVLAWSRNNY